MKIVATTQNINSVTEFEHWVKTTVSEYFPHEMVLCAAGNISGVKVAIERIVSIGYPSEFLDHIGSVTDLISRPVLRRWLTENKPQLVDECMVTKHLSSLEQEEVKVFGLVNIAAYGVLDLNVGRGTYFSFSRVPGPLTERHGKLLEMVVPFLHHALLRATCDIPPRVSAVNTHLARLTPKQREILSLIGIGLTNREIADRLARSELTIQTHVHSLLKKLNVPNRAAAIALIRSI